MKNSCLILSFNLIFVFTSTSVPAQPAKPVHMGGHKKINVFNERVSVLLPKSFRKKNVDLSVLKSDYPALDLVSYEQLEDNKGCSVGFFESGLEYVTSDYGMTSWKCLSKIADHFNMIKSFESGYKKINRMDVYYMDFIFSDEANKLYYAMVAANAFHSKYMFSFLVVPAGEYKSWQKLSPGFLNSVTVGD